MKGGVCTSSDRIDDKVVIVTGANTGIGRETAKELLLRGGKVYMACRSLERGQRALDEIIQETQSRGQVSRNLILMHLDLNSLKSVRQFAKEFKETEKKLDILINNAGVFWVPENNRTEDGFEQTFGVNHLGHFLLTNLLMDVLAAASPSRIINVSSLAHYKGIMNWNDLISGKDSSAFYAQSKLANLLFTAELASRLKGTGVTVYSLHPGVVKTELGRHIAWLHLPVIREAFAVILYPFIKNSLEGAQTSICCAIDSKLASQSGKYYSDCVEKKPAPQAENMEDARRLWDVSLELVKLAPSDVHPLLQ